MKLELHAKIVISETQIGNSENQNFKAKLYVWDAGRNRKIPGSDPILVDQSTLEQSFDKGCERAKAMYEALQGGFYDDRIAEMRRVRLSGPNPAELLFGARD